MRQNPENILKKYIEAPLIVSGERLTFATDPAQFAITNNKLHLKDARVDHGGLTGLNDDDHGQYLTEVRHAALMGDHVTNGDSHDHSSGDGAQIDHTGLSNLNSTDYTHLSAVNHTDLTDAGNSTLHYHATDRDSANFTGTNWSDLTDAGATTLHKHDHGGMDGLTDDDHSQYCLLAGRSGGQTITGGTAASNTLTLSTTSNGTKGKILFGTSAYDEVNNRLGIGVTSPEVMLHIKNESDHCFLYLDAPNAKQSVLALVDAGTQKWQIGRQSTSNDFFIYNNGRSVTEFSILATSGYATIATRLGIGTTPTTAALEVNFPATASAYVATLWNNRDAADSYGLLVRAGNTAGSGTTYYFIATDYNGDWVGYLQNSGGVFSLVDASDERLKENIVPTAARGLDIINSLSVLQFTRKKSKATVKAGFVAQQVRDVCPEAVAEQADGTLGVSQSTFIPYLVKAVQELLARVEVLESQSIHMHK